MHKGNALVKVLWVLAVLILIGAGVFIAYAVQQQRINDRNATIKSLQSQLNSSSNASNGQTTTTTANTSTYTSSKGVKIYVYFPPANAKLTSPVAVVGQVPGNWSSEASFPIKLLDSQNKVVAQATGHVLGDWQTSQLVPFSAQLTYSGTPASGKGSLVIQKDNPSGLSQNDDSVTIPINF